MMENGELGDVAGTQYAVLRSLCYQGSSTVSIVESDPTVIESSTVHAETDGFRLTKVNGDWYRGADMEERFVTLLHEVAHSGDGCEYGRGASNHSPDFWNEFIGLFNVIADSETNRQVIRSLFESGFDDRFCWHRAKYRAVQHISQVDKRSETVNERREKVAEAIGYDMNDYQFFERTDGWGLAKGKDEDTHSVGPDTVYIHGETGRFADGFSDDELREFIEECDGMVPCPLILLDVDERRSDKPQIVSDSSEWILLSKGREASRKALAVQERLGHGYFGLCVSVLLDSDCDMSEWSQSLPIEPDEMPNDEEFERELKFYSGF